MPVDAPAFPVNLILAGRRCLVVGAGTVALRKIKALLAAEATVHVIALRVDERVRALPLTWEERAFEPGDVAGFRLVTAATDDPAVNSVVFRDGELHGIWVNAADEPQSCSFTLPAVMRRGPLVLTVSTGGHSPALSTWIKNKLTSSFGPEYEVLLTLLSELRLEIQESGRSTEGLSWQEALDNGLVDFIRDGRADLAAAELRRIVLSDERREVRAT